MKKTGETTATIKTPEQGNAPLNKGENKNPSTNFTVTTQIAQKDPKVNPTAHTSYARADNPMDVQNPENRTYPERTKQHRIKKWENKGYYNDDYDYLYDDDTPLDHTGPTPKIPKIDVNQETDDYIKKNYSDERYDYEAPDNMVSKSGDLIKFDEKNGEGFFPNSSVMKNAISYLNGTEGISPDIIVKNYKNVNSYVRSLGGNLFVRKKGKYYYNPNMYAELANTVLADKITDEEGNPDPNAIMDFFQDILDLSNNTSGSDYAAHIDKKKNDEYFKTLKAAGIKQTSSLEGFVYNWLEDHGLDSVTEDRTNSFLPMVQAASLIDLIAQTPIGKSLDDVNSKKDLTDDSIEDDEKKEAEAEEAMHRK